MTRLSIVAAFGILSAISSLPAEAGSEPAEHQHDTEVFSAGEPGDPEKPSRVIQVTMQESDGKMLFVPNHVEVRKGEQIKFVLHNNGELDHEFVLATAQENQKHAEGMKRNPEMEHHDPNATRVPPKKTDEIVWNFTKAGEFEFACLIPGQCRYVWHRGREVTKVNQDEIFRSIDVNCMSRTPSSALRTE